MNQATRTKITAQLQQRVPGPQDQTTVVVKERRRRSGVEKYHVFVYNNGPLSFGWALMASDYSHDGLLRKTDWAFPSLNVKRAITLECVLR